MHLDTLALVLLLLLAAPLVGEAQEAGKMWRIGYLSGGDEVSRGYFFDSFRRGMRELGYVEEQNLLFDARFAEGKFERLPSLARELLGLNPDALLVATTAANLAAKAATSTVPIVMVSVGDPVGVGLVHSLARPGGNMTGITNIVAELVGKRLELLKEIVPTASRVAVLVNPNSPIATVQMRNAEAAARLLRVHLQPVLEVRGAADLEGAFERAVRAGAGAGIRMADPLVTVLRKQTVELAVKHRLPLIYAFREDVEAGGLVAYGTSLPDQYRQAASLVHKILRGAKPADLPIEQPTKFELVINLKTAKALGLTIPPSLLLRADHVIQ